MLVPTDQHSPPHGPPALPATTEFADNYGTPLVRLTSAIGLAGLAYVYPETAIGAPLALALTERLLHRPQRMLLQALKAGRILDLSDERTLKFAPMANRFFEAARQGEYDHNLRLLAAFLASEVGLEDCEPGRFSSVARKIEGLSVNSLQAVALIGALVQKNAKSNAPVDRADHSRRLAVTAACLANAEHVERPMKKHDAADALSDLAGRGLLYTNGGSFAGKTEEFYHPTGAIFELIDKARLLADAGKNDGYQGSAADQA